METHERMFKQEVNFLTVITTKIEMNTSFCEHLSARAIYLIKARFGGSLSKNISYRNNHFKLQMHSS